MKIKTVFTCLALSSAALLSGCDNDDNNNSNNSTTITATLEGKQENPPVMTANTAEGTITLTQNGDTTSVSATVVTSGFVATAVHVHEEFAGANGNVVFGLVQDPTDMNRWTFEGTITAAQKTAVDKAGFYFNAHSSAHGTGEVRGQIVPTGFTVKHFLADGSQENPPVTTSATGFAGITVNNTTGEVIVNAESTVTNTTNAHIHQGAVGVNGLPLFSLTKDGNKWNTPANTILSADDSMGESEIQAFENGNLYLNIHSDTHSGGEIRGQVPAN